MSLSTVHVPFIQYYDITWGWGWGWGGRGAQRITALYMRPRSHQVKLLQYTPVHSSTPQYTAVHSSTQQ